MSNRSRRQPKQQPAPKRTTPTKTPPPKVRNPPPRQTAPRTPGQKGFGTSSTDNENHVHVPPEMMERMMPDGISPDLMGNDFMRTMLA